MGQIVRKKKKGRPSKADLARRNLSASDQPDKAAPDRELRRSVRRRNVRYTFDFDDYLDDDDYFEDEEDERRRQKKLKLLLKLQSTEEDGGGGTESSPPRRTQRVNHAPDASASSSEDDIDGRQPSKKRKINGDDEGDYDDEEREDADCDENENENENEDDEVRVGKAEEKGADSAPGTPSKTPSGLPLPEKRILELILDKLQKKDIYGVYAEPVDPEELPDYHEVIEHPMDFATVRRKLGNGSYATLEQFENDVLLICTNAMQYNAPDTIYYKQARSIQELATKKFEKLRNDNECSEKERKTDQKTRYSSIGRKQIKKPISRVVQEPVGSDFSSGATLATAIDSQNGNAGSNAGLLERSTGIDGLVEGNPSIVENIDKPEEALPGKGPLTRFGRKPNVHDENRRATYNISNQPEPTSESVLSTFEGDSKLLVPVGLYAEQSYARSLARFAATLGPVAWKVASKRIEQALPAGSKFGRGWVGEYEPLPTPALMHESHTLKEPPFFRKPMPPVHAQKDVKTAKSSLSARELSSIGLTSEGIQPSFHSVDHRFRVEIAAKGTVLGANSPIFSSGNNSSCAAIPVYQQQSFQSRDFIAPDKKALKQVQLNTPSSSNEKPSNFVAEPPKKDNVEVPVPVSRPVEVASRDQSLLQSGYFKQPNNKELLNDLPVGKGGHNSHVGNGVISSSSGGFPTMQQIPLYAHHRPEQGLSDPVQLMRMLSEKAQNQQKLSTQSPANAIPAATATQTTKREDATNAAAVAARAWMSIGGGGFRAIGETTSPRKTQISAESLYNPSRELQPPMSRFQEVHASGMHFQFEKNSFPLHAFVPQPTRVGIEAQFQSRPVGFPQSVAADLSRFQVPAPWQSLGIQVQPRHKQESRAPDLNIGYQSSGSPGRPSSGIVVDSQQPDLALQL